MRVYVQTKPLATFPNIHSKSGNVITLMCAEKANELVSSRCKKNYLFLSLTESLSLPEFLFYVAKKAMGLGRISCKGGQ